VDRNGVDGIINSEVDEKFAAHQVEETGKDSNHNSGPGFDGGTSSSNCDEASETPVHGVTKIPGRNKVKTRNRLDILLAKRSCVVAKRKIGQK
jgi:hypothetical protein